MTGWSRLPLGDIVQPRRLRDVPANFPELPYIGMEHVVSNVGKIRATASSSEYKSSASRVFQGDVLYGRLRPYLNKVAVAPCEAFVSGEFIVLPRNDVVLSKFLQYRLLNQDFVEFTGTLDTGDRPRVSWQQVSRFAVDLPSLPEQHKIVELLEDHLSRLDAALVDVKQARIKSAQFRQSLLDSVFYGNKFDSVHLGTCIDLIMGQAPPGITCNKNGEGTPFVKVGEFAELYPTIEEWTLKPLRLAKAGDVLICVVGATVGKINLGIDCAIGRSVAAIRPKNTLLQKYLYYFLELKMLEIRGQSKGSAQGVITKDYINSIQIPLPDLKVQQDILDLLESNFLQIEKSVEMSNIIEHESLSLRRSLLQAAFTGQLAKEVARV